MYMKRMAKTKKVRNNEVNLQLILDIISIIHIIKVIEPILYASIMPSVVYASPNFVYLIFAIQKVKTITRK